MLRSLFHAYRIDLTALVVVIIWGISAPVRKAALAQFDVLSFTALRFLGMLVLAWSVLCWHRYSKGAHRHITLADLLSLALSGVCGYTVYVFVGLVGLHYTTAFSNSLLLATAPLFATLVLWGCRLRTVGWGFQHSQPQIPYMLVKLLGENAIPIVQHENVELRARSRRW